MRVYDIIKKKRDGIELTPDELSFIIGRHTSGDIPDYQLAAFLMAVYFRGMTDEETIALTRIMLNSGVVVDLSDLEAPKIDKHSTGGVGDKTSIILAPLLAAAGIAVPMVSGRGLGHTGGTLDKLESIPGFRTALSLEEFRNNLKKIGVSMIGQTDEIAPADRKLYALRDVTATIDSVPLIASSIMSKKLAEGIDGLVLDVKVGAGAFMKNIKEARRLAHTLVKLGNSMGVKTVAILTDMEQPLGKAIGNSLEIKECMSALRGRWAGDLKEVTLTLGSWMIEVATMVSDFTFRYAGKDLVGFYEYKKGLLELIRTGSALEKFEQMVHAQHGYSRGRARSVFLPSAKATKQVTSSREGYIERMDAEKAGIASLLLGSGRQKAEDRIDHSAGIVITKKVGDHVAKGEPMAVLHFNAESGVREAEDTFLSGIAIGREEVERDTVILEVIQ